MPADDHYTHLSLRGLVKQPDLSGSLLHGDGQIMRFE